MLMWAHYGNSHKGIAIKYNTKRLLDSLGMENDKLPDYSKINYLDFERYLNNDNKKNPNKLDPILINFINSIVKSDIWKYENEWRILFKIKDTERKKYYWKIVNDNNTIEEVTFGKYFFRDSIKNISLNKNKITFFIDKTIFPLQNNFNSETPTYNNVLCFFNYIVENKIKTSMIISFITNENEIKKIKPNRIFFHLKKVNDKFLIEPSKEFAENFKNYPNPNLLLYNNLKSIISIIG